MNQPQSPSPIYHCPNMNDIKWMEQHVKFSLATLSDHHTAFLQQEQEFIRSLNKFKWNTQKKLFVVWLLLQLIKRYNVFEINYELMVLFSKYVHLPVEDCLSKWVNMVRSQSRTVYWTSQQDSMVRTLQRNYVNNWTKIAVEMAKMFSIIRGTKEIRERWNNYLNPNLQKVAWTQEEDEEITLLVARNGRKWSLISRHLKSRNENQIKNRYLKLQSKGQGLAAIGNRVESLESQKTQPVQEWDCEGARSKNDTEPVDFDNNNMELQHMFQILENNIQQLDSELFANFHHCDDGFQHYMDI